MNTSEVNYMSYFFIDLYLALPNFPVLFRNNMLSRSPMFSMSSNHGILNISFFNALELCMMVILTCTL